MKKFKTIGILGGMGPAAGVEFAERLIELNKKAREDQDHPPFILYSNSLIPKRIEALVKGTESPVSEIVTSFETLKEAGCDFGVMACNTAHAFWKEIKKNTFMTLISLIEETVKYCVRNYPDEKRVGILSTKQTLDLGLYKTPLRERGIELVEPDEFVQEKITAAIFDRSWGIKATGNNITEQANSELINAANHLSEKGVKVIILGCTEISMVKALWKIEGVEVVDAVEVLAERCLELARVK